MVALSLAQQNLSSWNLNAENMPIHQLVTNAKPCIMCFGCCHWSGTTSTTTSINNIIYKTGIKSLVYAAESDDVEKLTGFDEGPVPENWKEEFKKRGIEVISGIRTEESKEVLKLYKDYGRYVYNPDRN